MIKVASFNLLADGLCENEFFTVGSEDNEKFTKWENREDKIIAVLQELFEEKICSVIVTQETDHFFRILSKLRAKAGSKICGVYGRGFIPETGKHSTNFEVLKKRNQSKDPTQLRTFAEECREFTSVACNFYEQAPNDVYISDDGIGVFYRSDLLDLRTITTPLMTSHAPSIVSDVGISVLNADTCVKCDFLVRENSKALSVYGAHLKSGEDIAQEIVRYEQLQKILQATITDESPVIIMDSNNSAYYEQEYPTAGTSVLVKTGSLHVSRPFPGTISSLIKEFDMKDLISFQEYNQCLKMRHGNTNQKSKAFHFMFDTIDKILIRSSMAHEITDSRCHSFLRYHPDNLEFFRNIRMNAEERNRFHDDCVENVTTTCPIKAFGTSTPFAQLYPNEQACSDHPPVIASFYL
jgi:hypothetical protein